ncbi:MAG: hypothetical protein ACYTG5_20280, partial [Planctomycetota bacterium]
MKSIATAIPAIGILSLLIGCSSEESQAAQKFGYEGDIGPEHWADLNPDWILAKTGQRQSPIDLVAAAETDVPDLLASYQEAAL